VSSVPVRVLLVDDSRTFRCALKRQFGDSSLVRVIGEVGDATKTMEAVRKLSPDVIVLDLNMPGINGFDLLTQLKPTAIPSIVVSGVPKERSDLVGAALKRGAFALIRKPRTAAETSGFVSELLTKIQAAYESTRAGPSEFSVAPQGRADSRLLAIGASTGGTRALREVLTGFGDDCPTIVIAQHMMPGMLSLFAAQLNAACSISVRLAEKGDEPKPGTALLAPGDQHLVLVRKGERLVCDLTSDVKVEGQRPAVDVLFESVAKVSGGRETLGVILTGMGRDGAKGLLEMRRAGCTTVAEDERDCVVFGMPKAAIELKAAMHVERLGEISSYVTKYYQNL